MNFSLKSISSLLVFIFISFTLISCSKDEPLSPTEEHFEAEGVVFYQSGTKIVEIFRGVTQDTFFVPVNGLTPTIEVRFLNPNKQEILPPDYKKQPMSWEIVDTSLVSVRQNAGEEGSYKFQFSGKNNGITQVEFFILHEGHPDFRSGKIPVRVR